MHDRYNVIRETTYEPAHLLKEVEVQKIEIEILRLKVAKYKAYLFHHSELAEKLGDQIMENLAACAGEFDGSCYVSWRIGAIFRTLEDMARANIITEKEYAFCNERH